jgi:hypothetical protein
VPAEAPALSVFVLIDDPSKEGIYGGVVAAPAFSKIGETALREFNVPPPATDIVGGGKTDPTKSDPTKAATASGTNAAGDVLTVQRTADGRVRAPAAGTETPTTLPAGSSGTSGTSGATGGTTATTVSGTRPPVSTTSKPVTTTTARPPTPTTAKPTSTTLPKKP